MKKWGAINKLIVLTAILCTTTVCTGPCISKSAKIYITDDSDYENNNSTEQNTMIHAQCIAAMQRYIENSENIKPPRPPYAKVKQEQKLFLQQLPLDVRYIIGDFAGLNLIDTQTFNTPLNEAIYRHNLKNIQTFIVCGANINHNNNLYSSDISLNIAIQQYTDNEAGYASYCAAMRKYEFGTMNFLQKQYLLVRKQYNVIIRYLIMRGANINNATTNKHDYGYIHKILHPAKISLLRFFIAHKAPLNILDYKQRTPLDRAEKYTNSQFPLKTRMKYSRIYAMLKKAGAQYSTELTDNSVINQHI